MDTGGGPSIPIWCGRHICLLMGCNINLISWSLPTCCAAHSEDSGCLHAQQPATGSICFHVQLAWHALSEHRAGPYSCRATLTVKTRPNNRPLCLRFTDHAQMYSQCGQSTHDAPLHGQRPAQVGTVKVPACGQGTIGHLRAHEGILGDLWHNRAH
jgi:hypothetical protein